MSFVLNDAPNQSISRATREKVLQAASELGYTPSAEARALRSGRSAVILCLLPDWPVAGNIGVLLEELSAQLAEAGYTMLSHQRTSHDRALSAVLTSVTPAAVVGMCNMTDAEVHEIERLDIGLIRWVAEIPGHPDQTGLSQYEIGRVQARSLVADGHRTLGYVLPEDDRLSWFSEPRLAGVRDVCRTESLPEPVVTRSTSSMGDVADCLRRWVLDQDVTAICAYNDEVAFIVLTAMRLAGLKAPSDLAVMGVDDSVLSTVNDPTISTIKFDLSGEAGMLAGKLVSVAQGRDPGPPPPPGDMTVIRRASTISA